MDNVFQADLSLFQFIHHELKCGLLDILLPLARNRLTWIPLYIYFVFRVWNYNKYQFWRNIVLLVVFLSLGDILCAQIIKPWIARFRPCQLYQAEEWFSDFGLCSRTFSFPSCHATNHSFIAGALLSFFSFQGKFWLVAWAFLVGFSQIYIGVHYPLDVFFGFILGAFLATICRKFMSLSVKKDG